MLFNCDLTTIPQDELEAIEKYIFSLIGEKNLPMQTAYHRWIRDDADFLNLAIRSYLMIAHIWSYLCKTDLSSEKNMQEAKKYVVQFLNNKERETILNYEVKMAMIHQLLDIEEHQCFKLSPSISLQQLRNMKQILGFLKLEYINCYRPIRDIEK